MAGVIRFHWADYLVLVMFLVMSALIGVFIGFKDRKKMTSKNFFTGGGDMNWGLVAFSMQASFLSSIFLLSMPVEIYAWGSMYYYLIISYLIGITLSGCFIMPIFYDLQLISAYEVLTYVSFKVKHFNLILIQQITNVHCFKTNSTFLSSI